MKVPVDSAERFRKAVAAPVHQNALSSAVVIKAAPLSSVETTSMPVTAQGIHVDHYHCRLVATVRFWSHLHLQCQLELSEAFLLQRIYREDNPCVRHRASLSCQDRMLRLLRCSEALNLSN